MKDQHEQDSNLQALAATPGRSDMLATNELNKKQQERILN